MVVKNLPHSVKANTPAKFVVFSLRNHFAWIRWRCKWFLCNFCIPTVLIYSHFLLTDLWAMALRIDRRVLMLPPLFQQKNQGKQQSGRGWRIQTVENFSNMKMGTGMTLMVWNAAHPHMHRHPHMSHTCLTHLNAHKDTPCMWRFKSISSPFPFKDVLAWIRLIDSLNAV